MRHPDFDIQAVCDHLQGTCMSSIGNAVKELYEGMTEEDLTSADYDLFDSTIFECESCGWFYDVGVSNANPEGGEDLCDTCYDELKDE